VRRSIWQRERILHSHLRRHALLHVRSVLHAHWRRALRSWSLVRHTLRQLLLLLTRRHFRYKSLNKLGILIQSRQNLRAS
jgi:hypothetical protein